MRTAGGGDGDLAIFFKRAKGGDGLRVFLFDFDVWGGGEGLLALRLGIGDIEDILLCFFLEGGGDGLFARLLFCARWGGGEGDLAFLLGVFFLTGGGLGERCRLPRFDVKRGSGSEEEDRAFLPFFLISDFF